MSLLLEFLFEILGEFLLEAAFELGIVAYKDSFERDNRHPVLATLGYAVIGCVVGAVWAFLYPHRLVSDPSVPGASLVVSPLLVGSAMHFWGRYRRARGRLTSNLATFHGGAAFAFGIALVRLWWVR